MRDRFYSPFLLEEHSRRLICDAECFHHTVQTAADGAEASGRHSVECVDELPLSRGHGAIQQEAPGRRELELSASRVVTSAAAPDEAATDEPGHDDGDRALMRERAIRELVDR